jgi:hypothetical protein
MNEIFARRFKELEEKRGWIVFRKTHYDTFEVDNGIGKDGLRACIVLSEPCMERKASNM